MCRSRHCGLKFTVLTLILVYCTAIVQGAALRPCTPYEVASSVFQLDTDCQWTSSLYARGNNDVRLMAGRDKPEDSAVTTIYAGTGPTVSSAATPPAGVTLQIERIVLVGFEYAAPGSTQPFLWPSGFQQQTGQALQLLDVRLVTADQAVFKSWLQIFRTNASIAHWTDNATFLHLPYWSDGRTTLTSVGLMLQTEATDTNPAQLPSPSGKNYVVFATNNTIIPSLLSQAAVVTAQPLLLYLTTNVSIGVSPNSTADGLPINRPVILVGLQTLPTSVDFQMVVNQLNATGSSYSNLTFVGLVLENLAPGDSISSAVAAPLSIAISNSVWAVYANRSIANRTRVVFFNTTLVVPQESEMAYVTYMFAMYTSPLPYLREQTTFWSDVVHVSAVQFSPCSGSSRCIIVHRMQSWYHQWTEVVLTAQPAVAAPLPVPVRPVTLDRRKPSPLVTAVHSAEDLRSATQEQVIGNRAFVLLLLSNISLETPANHSLATSPMTWIGSSWDVSAVPQSDPGHYNVQGAAASVSFGYRQSVFSIRSASDDALQLQQLALKQLPQGPQVVAAAAESVDNRRMPQDVWTILLWCIDRPMVAKQPLSLSGVALQLPGPEFSYLRSAVAHSGDFIVQLAGDDGAALTFQGASCQGPDCSVIGIASFQGPGMVAKNLTLSLDVSAEAAIPGYFWPGQSQPLTPINRAAHLAPWAVAVLAMSVSVSVLLAAAGTYLWWRHRRLAASHQVLPRSSTNSSKLQAVDSPRSKFWQRWPHEVKPRSQPEHHSCKNDGDNCLSVGHSGSMLDGSEAIFPNTKGSRGHKTGSAQYTIGRKASSADQATVPTSDADVQQTNGSQQQVNGDVSSPSTLSDNIAAGLERWRSSVSSTTLMLMQRRLDAAAGSDTSSASYRAASLTHPATVQQDPHHPGGTPPTRQGTPQLQLLEVLGEGSFGSVYLGNWRGKRVAVKIMHLPASALLNLQSDSSQPTAVGTDKQNTGQQVLWQKRLRQREQNSPPHMAVIEAVLSSTMCHPNVVQVYNYSLCPLTSKSHAPKGSNSGPGTIAGERQHAGDHLTGWQVEIIMEYCSEGSLRDALDSGLLCKPWAYLPPSAVLHLAHDVAAAMLHLHTEGIVHGDLKAGNVMLSGSADETSACTKGDQGALGTLAGRKLTAKVADFGLSMPLDPTDTHATLLPRGTPTHMSPELFMSGHVSKASDVFAFGIMLFEIITGQRAYAGVPIPLLPHEVARQGLRPTWPADIPVGCHELQQLAEACWVDKPQDRPTFGDILSTLDHWAAGGSGWPKVAAFSASPLLRSYSTGSSCSALQSVFSSRTGSDTTQQQELQQQQEIPGREGYAAEQHALDVKLMGGQDQMLPVPPRQQSNETVQEGDAKMPAMPGLCQDIPLSITPQQPNCALLAARQAIQQAGRDRSVQMSWSEVDFTKGNGAEQQQP